MLSIVGIYLPETHSLIVVEGNMFSLATLCGSVSTTIWELDLVGSYIFDYGSGFLVAWHPASTF